MTASERTRFIHQHLFQYCAYKRKIEDYMQRAMRQGRQMREANVRGSFISDPTGRGGVMLADMPEELQAGQKWVDAVDLALGECAIEDGAEEHGLVYIARKFFCLEGDGRDREKNRAAIAEICSDCGIQRSTFYRKIDHVTDMVMYHATSLGLI